MLAAGIILRVGVNILKKLLWWLIILVVDVGVVLKIGIDEEYSGLQKRSWTEPVENVNRMIESTRKKLVSSHSKENHDYLMKKFDRCLYCDSHIPLEDTSVEAKK